MKKYSILLIICFALLGDFNANSQIITTIVGGGAVNLGGDGGPATSAEMASPMGLAMDAAGNIYIADNQNFCVRKVNTLGIITTMAGNGISGYNGDGGNATAAMLNLPEGVAVDASNNVYIADTYNNRIRIVNTSGVISTFAGNGTPGFSGDGGGATAGELSSPAGLAFDAAGNMYIADAVNERIRKVSTSGIISTIAGSGIEAYYGDGGPASSAAFYNPEGVAVDAAGNIYVADAFNDAIRMINTSGIIQTIAGNGVSGFTGDGGQATSAELNYPYSIAVDFSGNIYIPDYTNDRVRIVNTAGVIKTIAGDGSWSFSGDGGNATAATLSGPTAIVTDNLGNTYLSDMGNKRVRRVNSSGVINTIAGSANIANPGDGGPAIDASLDSPWGISFDNQSNLYIADYSHYRIRMVNTSGIITTVAGNGVMGTSGDGGPATAAEIITPTDVAVDAMGQVYISDPLNPRIRMVNTSGIINTIAGNGVHGYSGDGGPATLAEIHQTQGIFVDNSGNIFIADIGNSNIRMVNTSGIITTIAGNSVQGYSGDGGPATAAELYLPTHLTKDLYGNLFFDDDGNAVIRMINTSGIISTIAGNHVWGYSGDGGPATSAELYAPWGVAVDNAGDILIADESNNLIRMVNTSGIISTIVGIPHNAGFSGDGGPATLAELNAPESVILDQNGNIYLSDLRNNRIRKVTGLLTNINTYRTAENVSVYPNPSSGLVYITINGLEGQSSISLYSVTGEIIVNQTKITGNQYIVNTAYLPAGIYLARITTDKSNSIIKKIEVIH